MQRRALTQRLSILYLAAVLLSLQGTAIVAQAAATAALFRSTDGGRSWARSDQGLPSDARVNAFSSIGSTVFAGTDAGVFASGNRGQTWHGIAGMTAGPSRVLALATLGPSVYAGTDRSGILFSSDGGTTWTNIPDFPSRHVRCLLAHAGKLYAGTDADGVFLSEDAGRTWTRLDQGWPTKAQAFALSAAGGKVFAGLYSQGLYAWEEENRRWTKTGPVRPLVLASIGETLVVGHNPGGIYTSGDLGATWSKATANPFADVPPLAPDQPGELASDAPVWELAAGSTLVMAGAASGIFYSEDQGRTWTRARTGLPEKSPGVAFLVRENLVLASTSR